MFPIVLIAGVTCAGKTQLAIEVAKNTHAVLLPIDQLQRYKYLVEGVGLESKLLKLVKNEGYQILSPWTVSGPIKYIAWLRKAILKNVNHYPIIIEGCCTGYLQAVMENMENDDMLKPIKIFPIDIDVNDTQNILRIENRISIQSTKRVIREIALLEKLGFINIKGLPFLLECENLFKHPEHFDKNLAWAIRISAKIYCPAYLALKGEISVIDARMRIINNVKKMQVYQSNRLNSFFEKEDIWEHSRINELKNIISNFLKQ